MIEHTERKKTTIRANFHQNNKTRAKYDSYTEK